MQDLDEMKRIGQLILTQDNRCTADVFMVVQERKRCYGIDDEYDPKIAWLYEDECIEVEPEKVESLEIEWKCSGEAPEGYRRVGYVEYWDYVTGFFTEDGAKAYIKRNGHNHRGELRIYGETLYRNAEMIAVKKFLESLAVTT